jgi:hypothetical protein
LIGAEIGIKTIAAVHSQCPFWVISGQTIAGQNPALSADAPIADIRWPRISRSRGPPNEIIWHLVAKLIRFDRCPVIARFIKSRETNGNVSKRIILDRKNHCHNRFGPWPSFCICCQSDPA